MYLVFFFKIFYLTAAAYFSFACIFAGHIYSHSIGHLLSFKWWLMNIYWFGMLVCMMIQNHSGLYLMLYLVHCTVIGMHAINLWLYLVDTFTTQLNIFICYIYVLVIFHYFSYARLFLIVFGMLLCNWYVDLFSFVTLHLNIYTHIYISIIARWIRIFLGEIKKTMRYNNHGFAA